MLFYRLKPIDSMLKASERHGLHRSLGALELTMLGVGAIIGTGIFVLTSEAAQKAGPGMMLSFVVAALVCGVAALCYSELASMVPVSGSAYSYTYMVVGELLAWMVGWALILEYAVGASAVAVGWSNHAVPLIRSLGMDFPTAISNSDGLMAQLQLALGSPASQDLSRAAQTGGWINLPAVFITLAITALLVLGTGKSARFSAILVIVKIVALTAFVALTVPESDLAHFEPFLPNGGAGVFGAAASIFFAYVGFDAVSTAAEETRNPQRNIPIGLFASLAICTIFYLLVAIGAIGTIGAQPILAANGLPMAPGSAELAGRCSVIVASGAFEPLVCSKEALVHVLDGIGWPVIGRFVGLAAVIALPSVILMMMFGQTRVFFTMARDGLLPRALAKVHHRYRTPHVVTWSTGIATSLAAATLPVGKLAEYSNSGTLFAFFMVAASVMILRFTQPDRPRSFRVPAIWLVAPLAMIGCLGLYLSLPLAAILVLPGWGLIGLIVYFCYGSRHSLVGKGE
jgi:APA family basic amino acid/polyamine antiporter